LIRFYTPYANLTTFEAWGNVTLHFFVPGRAEPVAPYPETILGYEHLSEAQKADAEAAIGELFTEEEFRAFRDLMQGTYGEDIRTGMLFSPVNILKPGNELGLGLTRPFARRVEGEGGGFFRLSEAVDDWPLPFKVWGYYTTPAR